MTYACPVWEFAAEIHPLKLRRLQNKAPLTIFQGAHRTPRVYMTNSKYIYKARQGLTIHNS
jgi:hypothetical protein